MKILLATTNPGKRNEIISAFSNTDTLEFITLEELDLHRLDVEENGRSYQENALIKAKAYFEAAGIPTIAEDSGIEISALQDELGIHTRRWGAGPTANDQEWLDFFMNRMGQEKDREARFVSHAVYIDQDGHFSCEGECRGTITHEVEGPIPHGIPLSAVFKPLNEDLVYSAMDDEHKNKLSHRGWAINKLHNWMTNEGPLS